MERLSPMTNPAMGKPPQRHSGAEAALKQAASPAYVPEPMGMAIYMGARVRWSRVLRRRRRTEKSRILQRP